MFRWHFKPKTAGEPNRDPIQGEFFATDAISDPGMALVREGVQNALDAGWPGEPVRVRIFLSEDAAAVPPGRAAAYFKGAIPHLSAEGNGLRPEDFPDWRAPCPFLAFEDFGTCGLEGDPGEAFRPRERRKNHFYHFFRAEGQTDKEASQRGSWGVGKHVFWRSSRISAVFGATVRASDGRRLLMGKTILKCHWVGDLHFQDGYFGIPDKDRDTFILPIEDHAALDAFRAAFRLERDAEPGLSVVVPWPDVDITHESLVDAVLRGYFYPILAGQLAVTVEAPGRRVSLDKESLPAALKRIGGRLADELDPLVDLAVWARTLKDAEKSRLRMPDPARAWKWTSGLFSEELLADLRDRFGRGERIALRVPVTVREKKQPPVESFYDVYLVRDNAETAGRPTFIREGVIIPKVDAPRTRGVRALVIVEDGPLAGFLRDAENPSHTEWQHDGSNFRGKYRSGRSDLTFIKRTVHEIVRILSEAETKEDKTLLADFFSLPRRPGAPGPRPGPKPGPEPPVPTPPAGKPVPFRIGKSKDGFSIGPGDLGARPPGLVEIQVAYDVRRGNPLKRYRPTDFDLADPSIALEASGLEILERRGNRLLAKIVDPKFSLRLSGFDRWRDLYVKIEPREELVADPAS